jgi:pimeloyl-ACP methyl ester carboxylesterase
MRVKYGVVFILCWISQVVFADQYQSNLISVNTEGQGSDVVLIHGFASAPSVWNNVLPALKGHTVHTVTIKGLAGAPSPNQIPANYLPALRDELLAYLSKAEVKQPVVIGHSMGGLLGLLMASKNSDALGQLIVVDLLPFYSILMDPNATRESVKPMAFMTQMGLLNMNQELFTNQATRSASLFTTHPDLKATLVKWSQTSNRQVYAQLISELMQYDARPELSRIKTPTTVIYSHRNTMPWSLAQINALYKSQYQDLNGVSLSVIEDSLHFIMWDQPEKLNYGIATLLQ